jgi:hypothetical protein
MADFTIALDYELKSQLDTCCSKSGTSFLDTAINYIKQGIKRDVIDEDDWDWDAPYTDEEEFYSPENVAIFQESVKQFEEGKVVTVTLDELKAMVNEKI